MKGKLVLGENVSQALQFVQSGAADIGVVALSLALPPAAAKSGRYWMVPIDAYPRMAQGGTILKRGANQAEARLFRSFLLSAPAREVLNNYGFSLP